MNGSLNARRTRVHEEKPQTWEWTRARVQDELPLVRVYARKSKRTYSGRLSGVCLEFPLVTFDGQDGQVSFEVSWGTILHCLNERTPIQF